MQKNEIRKENRQKRSAMTSYEVRCRSARAAEKFILSSFYRECRVLMLYMPLANETDTAHIMNTALADGKQIVLPVTDVENTDIIPCYADSTTVFEKGAFSIFEPQKRKIADAAEIDTVIVPGIAFSRSGVRVGFGKGFYDRFLHKTGAKKIGFCYDFQIFDGIAGESHDVSMDYIVSESGLIDCSKFRN